jgi:hypothetical protein
MSLNALHPFNTRVSRPSTGKILEKCTKPFAMLCESRDLTKQALSSVMVTSPLHSPNPHEPYPCNVGDRKSQLWMLPLTPYPFYFRVDD